jgi:predicted dehydrogenase
VLRSAIIGASHWHAKHIFEATKDLTDLVAISDPDPASARSIANELDCEAYTDYEALLDEKQLDLAFVYGRHSHMAAEAQAVLARGIPMAIEKPGGMNAAEVERLRDFAEENGSFATVAFTHRLTEWAKTVDAESEGGVTHASFRLLSGPPSRYYERGVPWMLDPVDAGGGSTINLSILFVDLFRFLTHREVTLRGAARTRTTSDLRVEDHSSMVIETADGVSAATIETGYSYPLQPGADLAACVETDGRVYLVDNQGLRTVTEQGITNVPMPTHHRDHYRAWVEHTISAIETKRPPLATLRDLHAAMVVIDGVLAEALR